MERKDCSQVSFKALMATQFFGALNDNLLKTVVSLLIVGAAGEGGTALSIAAGMFVIPYLLFSSYAGYAADRFSKTSIIRGVKVFEVLIILTAGYMLVTKAITGLFVALFLMGLHSAIFSPAKYGILPEMLESDSLSKGNGYMQFWTFVAILTGTAAGGFVMAASGNNMLLPSLALLSISALGLVSGFMVAPLPPANPGMRFERNPFREVFSALRKIRAERALFLTLLALSYFWFMGAVFQLNIYLYAREMLQVDDLRTALLVTALAVGIGFGSILAGKVSEGKVEMGLIPIGALGISLFSVVLSLSYVSYSSSLAALFALGLSGGFFVVPLSAFMQKNSPRESRGRYLAATNFISFTGVLAASFAVWLFHSVLELTSAEIFFVIGCTTVGVTLFIFKTLPEAFVRCVNWLLTHTVYTTKVVGHEHVPSSGGALLVCNHASFVDPSLLLGATERPIRFLMFRPIYNAPVVGWFARAMRAIPVSARDNSEAVAASLKEAQDLLRAGELVCIFAEGSITRTGQLLPFRKGFERIMEGLDCPIIPVHIDRIWGSIFSFRDGKFLWKLPKELPYPVTLSFGPPLPAHSRTYEVREAVQLLASEAFRMRATTNTLLHLQFIRTARRHPMRKCVADSIGTEATYLSVLTQSLALAEVLRQELPQRSNIGIVLPPSHAAAVVNCATLISGHVPVNLNYTASSEALESACAQADIQLIITSKKMREKLGTELPRRFRHLEDLATAIGLRQRVRAALRACFVPQRLLAKRYGWSRMSTNDTATIVFSSGSTGNPKGVVLSHGNISSNIQSLYDLVQVRRDDVLLAALPFFHSFGFTGTLWFPLLAGIKAVHHFNPLDAATMGKLASQHSASILMGTPTFLNAYQRKCSPERFRHLRLVIVGAEKLNDVLADEFEKKFGVRPLEGYGCTELSPVAVLNVPDYADGPHKQTGNKRGKAGHPIPGVVARIVDPDTGTPLPPDRPGLLLIRGPNVMQGYLNQPERTAAVVRDGWYDTGDIASMDRDGFITITDRLSRFSKIGGEMVPHIKIEEEIHLALETTDQCCIVTALPHESKGEQLVVLSTIDIDVTILLEKLTARGIPNLWIPKQERFFRIAEIPMLGTGKIDLMRVRAIAAERMRG